MGVLIGMAGKGLDLDEEDLEKLKEIRKKLNISNDNDYRIEIIKLLLALEHYGYSITYTEKGWNWNYIETKNWSATIHVKKDRNVSNNFFFNVSLHHIEQYDYFIFICDRYRFFYIIPKDKMRELSNVSTVKGTQIKININDFEHTFRPGDGKKIEIDRYYQKIDLLTK